MEESLNIALIGCGKMGSALLRGWLASDEPNMIYVVEPHGLPQEFEDHVCHCANAQELLERQPLLDILVLAVKPQVMDQVCAALKDLPGPDTLIVSIAAGQPISVFEKHFGKDSPVIRVMPNTPAAIGKGISVAVPNKAVKAGQKSEAEFLFAASGDLVWLDDENLMDAVTAVSGSGPAYVFYLIETLAAGGEKAGLPADIAMKLARQTVIGSAALAEQDADTPAATLRENVTSPGGTTAAALEVLRDSGRLQDLMDDAVAAATNRGKELGGK